MPILRLPRRRGGDYGAFGDERCSTLSESTAVYVIVRKLPFIHRTDRGVNNSFFLHSLRPLSL
jgi:hypothetical protein